MTSVAHVGMTVSDLDGAVRWYRDVLALEPLGPAVEVVAGAGHGGTVAADVFGPRFGRLRQAHLTSANGVGLELFEFAEPDAAAPWTAGVFHFCLVVADIETAAERIAASGGRRRTSRVWPIFEGEPYRTCYCEDPFGNVFELYSHSHERTYANRPGA